jgi:hypothetical protein
MNNVATVLGALGGVVVFIAGLLTVIRGIFKQVNATEANTRALREVTEQMKSVNSVVGTHESRISRLEGARHQ